MSSQSTRFFFLSLFFFYSDCRKTLGRISVHRRDIVLLLEIHLHQIVPVLQLPALRQLQYGKAFSPPSSLLWNVAEPLRRWEILRNLLWKGCLFSTAHTHTGKLVQLHKTQGTKEKPSITFH